MGTDRKSDSKQREPEPSTENANPEGLEGAGNAGIFRHAPVEGGEELSIGGGPPSGAGGPPHPTVPTREDFDDT